MMTIWHKIFWQKALIFFLFFLGLHDQTFALDATEQDGSIATDSAPAQPSLDPPVSAPQDIVAVAGLEQTDPIANPNEPDSLPQNQDEENPPAAEQKGTVVNPADIEEVIVTGAKGVRVEENTSLRVLTQDIFLIPGLGDDALTAVGTFAGINALQSNFNGPGNGYYFRGSNREDNRFEIDGLTVDYVYHLGGPFSFSVVNGRLIDELAFYASNPSFSYANVNGGIIDIQLKAPTLEGARQEYDIGTLSAGGMVESGFGNGKDGFWLAFRRSYIDLFLNAANISAGGEGPDILNFPEFYDIQGRWHRELDEGFTDVTFIVSRDEFLARFPVEKVEDVDGEEFAADPQFQGDFGSLRGYTALGWRLQLQPSNTNTMNLQVNALLSTNQFRIGTQGPDDPNPGAPLSIDGWSQDYEVDWDQGFQILDNFNLRYGFELTHSNLFTRGYIGRAPSPDTGIQSLSLTTAEESNTDVDAISLVGEFFIRAQYFPIRSVGLEVGLRTHNSHISQTSLDDSAEDQKEFSGLSPRLHIFYAPAQEWSLYYRWGDFIQLPSEEAILANDSATRSLAVIQSRSNLLGVKYSDISHELRIDLWHKDLNGLVLPDNAICSANCYSNRGQGSAWGLDLEWHYISADGHDLRLSYAWLTTRRRNGPSEPSYPSSADQPHTIKMIYSGPLSSSGRWRWGFYLAVNSGQPYTQAIGREQLEGFGFQFYDPIYGNPNAERLPPFLKLDVGFNYISDDRSFETRLSLLSVNSFFYENNIGYDYDETYSNLREPGVVSGDFAIPSLVFIFRL